VDIKILDEDKCISLLCSLPDLWDSLVVAIGSNTTTSKFDDVVSSLLLKEMRRKTMDIQRTNSFSIRGHTLDRNKNKSSSGRSKYRGRSKYLGKSLNKCWKCGKVGNFKKDCKSKSVDICDVLSIEGKASSEEGGDVYLDYSSTRVDHDVWLITLGSYFHMTPHREWFSEYEKYNGGEIFLGDYLTN